MLHCHMKGVGYRYEAYPSAEKQGNHICMCSVALIVSLRRASWHTISRCYTREWHSQAPYAPGADSNRGRVGQPERKGLAVPDHWDGRGLLHEYVGVVAVADGESLAQSARREIEQEKEEQDCRPQSGLQVASHCLGHRQLLHVDPSRVAVQDMPAPHASNEAWQICSIYLGN